MSILDFDKSGKLIVLDIGIISADSSWLFYVPVILDTGATTTILSTDIFASLGYDPGNPNLRRTRIITGSGVEYSPCINIKGIIAGGEWVSDIKVLCHDLPSEAGIDGLLGLNFVKSFDLTISYSSGKLHFKRIEE